MNLRRLTVPTRAAPLVAALALVASLALPALASAQTVVHRVNVGGPTVSDPAGDWAVDSDAEPSPFVNVGSPGIDNATSWPTGPFDLSDSTVPPGTPAALFDNERFDGDPGAPDMTWAFPVTNGRYELRLYAAETFVDDPGKREYDVTVEGQKVLENLDVYAQAGGMRKAIVKSIFTKVTDGTLNVSFAHEVQNPVLSAIEVVEQPAGSGGLAANPGTLAFGASAVNRAKPRTVQIVNTNADGGAAITLDETTITGANAGDFSDTFDDGGANVTLQPGEATTIPVTYTPADGGSRTATLHVTPTSGPALDVPLTGTATGSGGIAFSRGTVSGTKVAPMHGATVIQWGPDGKLYVAYSDGMIRAYTIDRVGSTSNFAVTHTEEISEVNDIQNHNDDGTPVTDPSWAFRLVTGMVVTEEAGKTVIYTSSSDPRRLEPLIDTNSSTVSKLTKNSSTDGDWSRVDLVRGLPRSKEDHSANGLAISGDGDTLFVAVGGLTNIGAPSVSFKSLPEYALSAAVLRLDLGVLDGSPTYDVPTLDDEDRAAPGAPDFSHNDVNDPFGGNAGKNQARIVPGGPVQIQATGMRNPYDVLVHSNDEIYTIDNGSNANWGGLPVNEGPAGTCTNAAGVGEGVTDPDELHRITNVGYYGGHPNPTRANPAVNTFNGTKPGSVAQSPVSAPNAVECDWIAPGVEYEPQSDPGKVQSLAHDDASTNGLAEYKASFFGGALKGDIIAANFEGSLTRFHLTPDGKGATKTTLVPNLGAAPLDVTIMDDDDKYPGSIWVVDQASGTDNPHIFVLEPKDIACTLTDPDSDEDGDGFTYADETANGTGTCDPGSFPSDHDGDHLSDKLDTDDDGDGILDVDDPFAIDPKNGTGTPIPEGYSWDNDEIAGGLLRLGFTGLMANGSSDYLDLFDKAKLTAGGAAGVFTVDELGTGDALGAANSQAQAFQFGVDTRPSACPPGQFSVHSRIVGPVGGFSAGKQQSSGTYLGDGTQANYAKIVLTESGVAVVREIGDSAETVATADVPWTGQDGVDLWLSVDRTDHTVQAWYAINQGDATGARVAVGPRFAIPAAWTDSEVRGLAVGVIGTSQQAGRPTTWDFLEVEAGGGAWCGAGPPTTPPYTPPTAPPVGPTAPPVTNPFNPPKATPRTITVARRMSISAALAKGVAVTCTAPRGGRCDVQLRISRATAKRLKIKVRGNAKEYVVGSARIQPGKLGRVKLVKAVRGKIRHASSVALKVQASIRTSSGRTTTVRRNLTLKATKASAKKRRR